MPHFPYGNVEIEKTLLFIMQPTYDLKVFTNQFVKKKVAKVSKPAKNTQYKWDNLRGYWEQ